MEYATHNLSQYVLNYLGRPVTMTKVRRHMYQFQGSLRQMEIAGRTAADARRRLTEEVSIKAPACDRRRNHWVYT